MKLIENTYKHEEKGFCIKVTTCNKRIATARNLDNDEVVRFNRGKFEWMINKGIFALVN